MWLIFLQNILSFLNGFDWFDSHDKSTISIFSKPYFFIQNQSNHYSTQKYVHIMHDYHCSEVVTTPFINVRVSAELPTSSRQRAIARRANGEGIAVA